MASERPVEICSEALRSRVLSESGNSRRGSSGSKANGKKGWLGGVGRRLSTNRGGKKATNGRYAELGEDAKSDEKSQEEWLHPEHHIETGVEYHCDYVGSARIGNTIAPNAETQDAVLITARKAYEDAKKKPVTDGCVEVSSSSLLFNDAAGQCVFNYALDHVPFASCDATDPTKMYFVTMMAGSCAMLHLFKAKNRKEGLAFTFTVAQAFSVRWNAVKQGVAREGAASPRRATSPTGMLEHIYPTRRAQQRKESPCTLGEYRVRLASEGDTHEEEEEEPEPNDPPQKFLTPSKGKGEWLRKGRRGSKHGSLSDDKEDAPAGGEPSQASPAKGRRGSLRLGRRGSKRDVMADAQEDAPTGGDVPEASPAKGRRGSLRLGRRGSKRDVNADGKEDALMSGEKPPKSTTPKKILGKRISPRKGRRGSQSEPASTGGPVMFNGLDYGDSDEFDEEEEHVSVGYGTVVANNEVDDLSDLSDLDETDL